MRTSTSFLHWLKNARHDRRSTATLVLWAVMLVAGVLSMAALPAPKWTITIPLNSTTAIAATKTNTIASEAAGTSTADPNTFTMGAGATGTTNLYAGLFVEFTGAGSCANASGQRRIIKSNTSGKVATLDSPTSVAVDPNCTYVVGPRINTSCRGILAGGATGIAYYSTYTSTTGAHGGTALTMRFTLTAGQYREVWSPGSQWDYIEFLSSSATDTITLECE